MLRLDGNNLEGAIPTELGSLLKLEDLSLHYNNLTGTIPVSLGNLSSLREFFAYGNNLSGNIPSSLGQLKNLIVLSVADNNFTGIFPPSIFNITSLRALDIGSNHLGGSLPSEIGNSMPYLQFLGIGSNYMFEGSIPASISNASNLRVLQLGQNKLTGKVPSLEILNNLRRLSLSINNLVSGDANDLDFIASLVNATDLQVMEVNNNNFGGRLPEQIWNLSRSLLSLILDYNQITGSIPNEVGNLVNLQNLRLGENKLSGAIPSNIVMLQNLESLYLSNNRLSGFIPPAIGNLTNLKFLELATNHLQGNIPSSIGNCQYLLKLDLKQNNLGGRIPAEILTLPSLSIGLYLSENNLSGVLPPEVGNLRSLSALDISSNKLSGQIPSSLGSCTSLDVLSLSNNDFSGSLPNSLSSLKGLRGFDLSHNNFSGRVSDFFGDFEFLKLLNFSYNNFEGEMPTKGVFKNATAVSLVGNSKLCGGIPEFHLPSCSSDQSKNQMVKIIASTIACILSLALAMTCLFVCWSRNRRKESTSSSHGKSLMKVAYDSLVRATNGFSSANLIGSGSFGSVYKGIIDPQETAVAIKVFNLLRPGVYKSFTAECEALRNIKHRNVVKVITACSSVDHKGNDFKAFFYEFMDNGNLDQWLHQMHNTLPDHESPKKLNLLQRLNIAIDIASALQYLHYYCKTPIIHCDLKPSNVLLDKEMVGHVGDFGLAKFLFADNILSSANQSSSTAVKGTIGYAPPGYGQGSQPSESGDVYSYGILLLEMFTGKRPTDDMFKESWNLHSFVKTALPANMTEITDPILLQETAEEATINHTHNSSSIRNGTTEDATTNHTRNLRSMRNNTTFAVLNSIFELGISCSYELPHRRMNITDVVAKLSSVRNQLAKTRWR